MRQTSHRSKDSFGSSRKNWQRARALALTASAAALAGLSSKAAAEPISPPSPDADLVESSLLRCLPWLPCREVCVEFDAAPLGATYGGTANPPGTVVYVENGVPVSVDPFYVPPLFVGFGGATVEPQPANPAHAIGSGQIVRLNNINLTFDFTGVGFVPTAVRFEYLDLGGSENIFVDGAPILFGDLAKAPPGVTVAAAPLPPPVSGKKGTVQVNGAVHRLSIGGQELWIDRVCAVGGNRRGVLQPLPVGVPLPIPAVVAVPGISP